MHFPCATGEYDPILAWHHKVSNDDINSLLRQPLHGRFNTVGNDHIKIIDAQKTGIGSQYVVVIVHEQSATASKAL